MNVSMRVLITGGAGLIGRAAAVHLQECGWDIRVIDLAPEIDLPDAEYNRCDMMDFAAVREQMRGCDAVVHMAALRSPFHGPGEHVFRINTIGAFNVYEAAAKVGIRRVTQASSINAIGCAWNINDFSPRYLPVDEDHPLATDDPYSFSKQQIEEVGAYFWRRDGISGTSLRFPWVYAAEYHRSREYYERRDSMRQFLDEFSALPEGEQQRQLSDIRHQCLAFRSDRRMENQPETWQGFTPDGVDERLWQAYTFDRYNLWASLDVRDAAQAIEKSLTADYTGSHNLFINDTYNFLDYDSRTLARLFFPELTEWKQAIAGSEALFSINRARELIGFEPQYSLHGEPHA
jgi:nucleoside-diphosphate-sugar epimerase